MYQDEKLGLTELSCKFMSASIGNEYTPNEIENGIASKASDIEKMQSLQRNRPPIGQFYMKCVQILVPTRYYSSQFFKLVFTSRWRWRANHLSMIRKSDFNT